MTFGDWLIHSAQRNYDDCAILKSETGPTLTGLKGKEQINKALKDSFAYCAPALEHADEREILSSPEMSTALLHIFTHNNEVYGNIVGYLRSNGIVPPSTAARSAQTKK
jgi:hypothetical protein